MPTPGCPLAPTADAPCLQPLPTDWCHLPTGSLPSGLHTPLGEGLLAPGHLGFGGRVCGARYLSGLLDSIAGLPSSLLCLCCHLLFIFPCLVPGEPHPAPCSRLNAPASLEQASGKTPRPESWPVRKGGRCQEEAEKWEVLPTHLSQVRIGDRELGHWENKAAECPWNEKCGDVAQALGAKNQPKSM